ncbi:MAG: hypothetical protein KDI55_16145 [Anaerolineae bacterium]|nr:hypothetical protein [Anaerolineae bacterium]
MSTIKRIGGAILIVISIASLLFSLAALAGVWIVRKPITDTMTAGLMLASDTLEVTGRTLGVVDDGLATAGDLVASTQQTVDSLAITLDSTTPALQTVGDLVGSGVPAALTAANATIRTAQKSAETVDGVLTVLSQLPLLNISYNPEVPLSQALDDISTSLEVLPAGLEQLGEQVTDSVNNLPTLASATRDLATAVGDVNTTLDDSRLAVQDYQQLVLRYQKVVDFLQDATPVITFVFPLLLSLLIFWIMVVQVSSARQGWNWLRGEPSPVASAVAMSPLDALPPADQPVAAQIEAPAEPSV